jgi:proline iminopeptidase
MTRIAGIVCLLVSFLLGGCGMDGKLNESGSESLGKTREGYIPVIGGRVWYKVAGENKKGIPVLVVHGGPGASHDYLEPLAELADERPVVFYDQLGCGNSERPETISLWTIERFVDELHQVRRALGLKKLHIIGQSWGSSLAVDYLLSENSEGVLSLVLSGALLSTSRWIEDQQAYVADLPEETREIIQASEDRGDFGSTDYQDAMMVFYRIHVCRLDPWPECLNRSFQKLNVPMYEYMWGPSEFTVTGALKDYERVERLKEISIPVLFTCGYHDEATPATTRYYQRHLPGSEVLVLEGASHEHHLEKPQEYLEAVRAFLRGAEKESFH